MNEINYLKLEHLIKSHFRKYDFLRVGGNLILCRVGDFEIYADMNSMIAYVRLPSVVMNRKYYKTKTKAYRLKRKLNNYIKHVIKNKYL